MLLLLLLIFCGVAGVEAALIRTSIARHTHASKHSPKFIAKRRLCVCSARVLGVPHKLAAIIAVVAAFAAAAV